VLNLINACLSFLISVYGVPQDSVHGSVLFVMNVYATYTTPYLFCITKPSSLCWWHTHFFLFSLSIHVIFILTSLTFKTLYNTSPAMDACKSQLSTLLKLNFSTLDSNSNSQATNLHCQYHPFCSQPMFYLWRTFHFLWSNIRTIQILHVYAILTFVSFAIYIRPYILISKQPVGTIAPSIIQSKVDYT